MNGDMHTAQSYNDDDDYTAMFVGVNSGGTGGTREEKGPHTHFPIGLSSVLSHFKNIQITTVMTINQS